MAVGLGRHHDSDDNIHLMFVKGMTAFSDEQGPVVCAVLVVKD